MEQHIDCLKKLCRVCGDILTTQRVTYKCQQKRDLLLAVNINISEDNTEIHPPTFCNRCYSTLKHIKDNRVHASRLKIIQWTNHSSHTEACETCTRYNEKCKGGRKSKTKKGGNHATLNQGQIIRHITSLPLQPSYATSLPLEPNRFCTPPPLVRLEDFTCGICKRVVDQPLPVPIHCVQFVHNSSSFAQTSNQPYQPSQIS